MRNFLRSEFSPWLALATCLCVLFYPGLVDSEIPAFRDGYHFYYPQAIWLDRCAARGELFPTWNPDEGLGVSIAGQPSAALYYPLRILWWLPGLSLPQRYAIVCITHLLIAAAGMRYAARGLRLPRAAGWLAAFSYALSCPVLFQHTNLIYLCSAAWIGFALGATVRALRIANQELFRSCCVFGGACTMMTLGGDPHTTANSLIVAGMGSCARCFLRWNVEPSPGPTHFTKRWLGKLSAPIWLASGVVLVVCLTAIQWIPAMRWTSQSSRLADHGVAQPMDANNPVIASALRDAPPPSYRIYDFSLGPWYVATCVFPTLGGHYLAKNSRLFDAIPSEGRMWIPSLYFGLLPCWLIITTTCTHFTSRLRSRPLLVLLAMTLLAALGNYSIIWLLREAFLGFGLETLARHLPNDHVGTLSWLLAEVVPGYGAFRYPAKWTTWFSATACLLAAQSMSAGVHQWSSDQRTIYWTRSLLTISCIGLISSLALWLLSTFGYAPWLDLWLMRHAADPWLDAPRTQAIAQSATLAFAIPSLLLLILTRVTCSMPAIAMLTLAEMTVVAMPWVSFTPPPRPMPTPPIQLRTDAPFVWARSMPSEQLVFSTLGKLGLLSSARWFNSTQSIEPASVDQLKQWLSVHDQLSPLPPHPQFETVLAELGITHRLVYVWVDRLLTSEWQPVPDPKPFCELRIPPGNETGPAAPGSAVQWQWLNSTTLLVHATCSAESGLVVRQLNDGGWLIDSANENDNLHPLENALFIQVVLPPGEHYLRFQRKWLW